MRDRTKKLNSGLIIYYLKMVDHLKKNEVAITYMFVTSSSRNSDVIRSMITLQTFR